MPAFDPIKIFKRLWEMRLWGKSLVVLTAIATALAIISGFTSLPKLWFTSFAVIFWVTLIISYIAATAKKKDVLAQLVSDSEHIKARLTGESWFLVDKYDDEITSWDTKVKSVLDTSEYKIYCSNTGIEKPEDETIREESDAEAIRNHLIISRNYIHIRILRLKEIIAKL